MISVIRKPVVVLALLLFCAGIGGWTPCRDVVPMGPYPLVYPANFGNRINVPDGNPTTQQGVYLGRMLFYEPLLSANNKISCASCHRQELAFTDGMAFSEGVDGTLTPRSSMSLANLLWTRKFFWDGRVTGLEAQAAVPMTNPHEMGQYMDVSARKLRQTKIYPALFKTVFGDEGISGPNIQKAIAQFERTLISVNSKYDQYLRGDYRPTVLELQGLQMFTDNPTPAKAIRGANCARCHGGAKTYMELFHNNGLDSISKDAGIETLTGLPGDRGRFKVPTLRNIALTAPYMHDGRFKTLEEVLDHYSDHVKQSESLSPLIRVESNEINGKTLALRHDEKKAVIAFLNMLTDSAFVHDPRFSDPHKLTSINKKRQLYIMKQYLIYLFICLSTAAFAQKEATVKVSGEVTSPIELKLADIQQMPQTTVTRKDREGGDHTYTGVLLSAILQKAGATMGKDLKGENLTKYATVEASDGYQVVFALAELDKDFTDRQIILATTIDGKPLAPTEGPFRIIVENEKKPARCIKQVTGIKVSFAK